MVSELRSSGKKFSQLIIHNNICNSFNKMLLKIRKNLKCFLKFLHTSVRHEGINKTKELAESKSSALISFLGKWPPSELNAFQQHMKIIPNFISEKEEISIMTEIEPYMSRLHYEYDHWDDAIHGFRETERKQWYPENRRILDRVCKLAFDGEVMPYVHVLDLAEKGVIKPHVDSTRYCGSTIAGISLLSDCVMRLVRTDETKFIQTSENTIANDDYRNQPKVTLDGNFYADILLPRRSLYIMSHSARYNFTHEILANDESKFQGNSIHKTRRISIICRNSP